jgi:hypothetical protein
MVLRAVGTLWHSGGTNAIQNAAPGRRRLILPTALCSIFKNQIAANVKNPTACATICASIERSSQLFRIRLESQ